MLRTLLLLIVLSAVAAGAAVWDGWRVLNAPLPQHGDAVVLFERGQSLHALMRQMTEAGQFPRGRTRHAVAAYARMTDIASRLKAGEYVIEPGTTPLQFLQQLERGDVRQYRLTLVEGWSFREMMQVIGMHPAVRSTLRGDDLGTAAMAAIGKPELHPEGQFLPDTYQITRGTTDVAVLKRAHAAMRNALGEAWAKRAANIPLKSPEQALILASIIEKETGVARERPEIAGVFTRRLQRGMRLQTDPTVIYGIGPSFDGNIRRKDLRTDTPYNTYTRAGLPPTPICMPGRAALLAAVNPAPGKSLYFVSRGDGSHQFSNTLAEHNRAVARYQLGRGG